MAEYINRQQAIAAVSADGFEHYGSHADTKLLEVVLESLAQIPPADVALVKHGLWLGVRCEGPAGPWNGTCSVCNIRNDIPHPYSANYCPNCGAKMDKRD